MSVVHCTHNEFIQRIAQGSETYSCVATPATECVVVDLAGIDWSAETRGDHSRSQPSCVVIGVHPKPASANSALESRVPQYVDVVAQNAKDMEILVESIQTTPRACAMLVQLLRQSLDLRIGQALWAESMAYSNLQHGAEFLRFLKNNKEQNNKEQNKKQHTQQQLPANDAPPVLVQRTDSELFLTLNRPDKHNAYSANMRDHLCDALEVALWDSTIERVQVNGAGKSFCAGGDLAEFGIARDAAEAHLSRTSRSAGQLFHALSDRLVVHLQGACIGAGIELPGFAAQIVARPDSFFQLPEVSMGLVPGAGGTASLPRRIGRLRSAWLALSGQRIDAATALDWGLVDALDEAEINPDRSARSG